MSVNVRESFLDCTEQGDFYILLQPTKLWWQVKVDPDAAALREAIDVQANRRANARFIEQRGMKKVRDGACLAQTLLNKVGALQNGLRIVPLGREQMEFHCQSRQVLPETVMQPSRNSAAFVILQRQNSPAETPGGCFCPPAGGSVRVDFQQTHGLAIVVSQRRPAAGNDNFGTILPRVAKLSLPAVAL